MENKLGQNPAFPSKFTTGSKGEFGEPIISHRVSYGMSKRFYTACAAMQGLLVNADWTKTAKIADDFDEYKDRIASASYEFADELLKQENL